MVSRFVSEMTEGGTVRGTFVLRAKELRVARTGDEYLRLELCDRTGAVSGVLFRPSAHAVDVPTGSIVTATGSVSVFRGERRVTLDSLAAASTWDPADFLASSRRPVEAMIDELRGHVSSVKDKGLRGLLRRVFGDAGFFAAFTTCPGSQAHHHAHLGGLLEHTVAVAAMCDRAAGEYPGVERDLLVSAALLHDIGKVRELTYDTTIGFSDEGRLVGHVVISDQMICEAATRGGLDAQTLTRLRHAVISHHGELEWGSPKRPSTIEALVLHHVDNLDAKASGFAELLSGAVGAQESWTDAGNLFRRPLYAPRPAEDDRPSAPREDDEAYRRTA